MLHTLRIGARIGSADPFWVQTRESVYQHAQQLGIELIPIDIGHSSELTSVASSGLAEEILAQELGALICSYLPAQMLLQILSAGVPVIHLIETEVRHPLLVSAYGFYAIAQSVGGYLAERLGGRGQVLVVGGMLAKGGEDGRSRLAGFRDEMRRYPDISLRHIPSAWRYEHAYAQIEQELRQCRPPIDAIFGLSDSLALAARDAARSLGLLDERTVIVGVNGDPLALAAIAEGSIDATIDTRASEFGARAVDLACRAARRQDLPEHLDYMPRMVHAQNVAEVAMQKLIAIAELPSRLVGVNRQQERQQVAQMEASLEINRRIGSVLNRQRLSQEIADLIRSSYGYDMVQLLLWAEPLQQLVPDLPGGAPVSLADNELLALALRQNAPIFVPDMRHSRRFAPDPRWPATRSRVVLPIRFGGAILGLLDLHSRAVTQHTHQSLAGLQVLADQLGIAMRNAELYEEALRARDEAEKANQLKTRLLANVSHELRTPLNVILGYSQSALTTPNLYDQELPEELLHDLRHIYRSGEHLIRLINDLLDLSRAEIDELDLFPETIALQPFLDELFQSMVDGLAPHPEVQFQLDLPAQLPFIQADPVRLRQVLINLLSNARKFTSSGRISLGAEVAPPHLHIWVSDSGCGIPEDMRELIFEPFVTGSHSDHRAQGIGLGLAITRRLVLLHGGTLSVESEIERGSTFHIRLPLPSLGGAAGEGSSSPRATLLLIASSGEPSPTISELCARQGLGLHMLRPGDDLRTLQEPLDIAALAWDLGQAAPGDWPLIQQLRSFPQICQAPFILYGQVPQIVPEQLSGAVGLLQKPLSSGTLLQMIEALRGGVSSQPIMIIDDDPQVRELYRDLIAKAFPSYAVQMAENGEVALELLEQSLPSLIMLDLMMPKVDGFAVLERLRASERTWHIPVIILSGHTLSLDDIRRIDQCRVVFHSKDILAPGELVAALATSLDGQQTLARATSLLVKRATAYIQHNYMSNLSRQQIALELGISQNYLSQIFHQELGISPWEYLNRYRIRQAKALLRESDLSVTAVAERVGFEDASYFGRVFRKHAGCSPQTYRDQIARGAGAPA